MENLTFTIIGGLLLILFCLIVIWRIQVVHSNNISPIIEPSLKKLFDTYFETENLSSTTKEELSSERKKLEETKDMTECLTKFFGSSVTSREILRILNSHTDKMSIKEISDTLNLWLSNKEYGKIPKGVVQKILIILYGSNLIEMIDNKFKVSKFGKTLLSKI